MATLIRDASRVALDLGARCATDITGFGLLGLASHVARGSGVTIRMQSREVPVLPGVRATWERMGGPAGSKRNATYLEPLVAWGNADAFTRALLVDPQTSGGLLVCVAVAQAPEYLARVAGAAIIGDVVIAQDTALEVT